MKMGVQAYSSWYVPQRDSEDTSMDPKTTCCPNLACPARGQRGQGNIGIHSCKDKRFICTECHKTCSVTKGTAFYRLRTSAETVSLVADTHGPRMSTASDRGGLWVLLADGGDMGNTRRRPGPGRPGASGGATTRPGAGAGG